MGSAGSVVITIKGGSGMRVTYTSAKGNVISALTPILGCGNPGRGVLKGTLVGNVASGGVAGRVKCNL